MTEEQAKATRDAISVMQVARRRLFAAHVKGNTPEEATRPLTRAIYHLTRELLFAGY